MILHDWNGKCLNELRMLNNLACKEDKNTFFTLDTECDIDFDELMGLECKTL